MWHTRAVKSSKNVVRMGVLLLSYFSINSMVRNVKINIQNTISNQPILKTAFLLYF